MLINNTHTHTQEAALHAHKAEMELHQKIIREKADLTKAINSREENLRSLVNHRSRAKEDRRMLAEEKRVRERLIVWYCITILSYTHTLTGTRKESQN